MALIPEDIKRIEEFTWDEYHLAGIIGNNRRGDNVEPTVSFAEWQRTVYMNQFIDEWLLFQQANQSIDGPYITLEEFIRQSGF